MGQSHSRHAGNKSIADRFEPWGDFGLPILLGIVLLVAALLASGYARAQSPATHLIRPAAVGDEARYAQSARRPDLGVARQRPVSLDLSRLNDTEKAATNFVVELFNGRLVTLVKERVERRSNTNYTWQGKLVGYPKSYAVLGAVGGYVSGSLDTGEP